MNNESFPNQTKYPIYVISKGRWDTNLTAKSLDLAGVPYSVVIEPCEYDLYALKIPQQRLLVLPFENLNQGSIPARNWVWDHSLNEGHLRHWIIDDNIRSFFYFHQNRFWRDHSGFTFQQAERFVDRYTNIRLAGFEYKMFAIRTLPHLRPFAMNRRIYSTILVDNMCIHRWRGRYNEDTDLSLRVLKDGDCTIQFYAFLADKRASMSMKGGNTDTVYADSNNRLEFVKSLQAQHPDVVEITWKYNRWHHQVDYSQFRGNKLIRNPDYIDPHPRNTRPQLIVDDSFDPDDILDQ